MENFKFANAKSVARMPIRAEALASAKTGEEKMKSIFNRMAVVLALLLIGAIGLSAQPALAGGSDSGVVNINTASAKQLQVLKGIGAKKAQAIVSYRAEKPFESIQDLTKVKGIGKKLVQKLRSMVVLKGETTLKPRPKKKRKSS
jgi:competence protein ComEA